MKILREQNGNRDRKEEGLTSDPNNKCGVLGVTPDPRVAAWDVLVRAAC